MTSKYTAIIVTGAYSDGMVYEKLYKQATELFRYGNGDSFMSLAADYKFTLVILPNSNPEHEQNCDDFVDWLRSGSYVGELEWVEVAYGGKTELVRGSDICGLSSNSSGHKTHISNGKGKGIICEILDDSDVPEATGVKPNIIHGTYNRSKPTELDGPGGWPDAKISDRVFYNDDNSYPVVVNLDRKDEDDFIAMVVRIGRSDAKSVYHFADDKTLLVDVAFTTRSHPKGDIGWRDAGSIQIGTDYVAVTYGVSLGTMTEGTRPKDVLIFEWSEQRQKYASGITKDDVTRLYHHGLHVYLVGHFGIEGKGGFIG